MTDLSALVSRVMSRHVDYQSCSHEQGLAYACEDIVEAEIGSRVIASTEVAGWVSKVCEQEDMDPPTVLVARLSRITLASAHPDDNSMCLRGKSTTVATVLHELAHLSVGVDSHGVLWRDEFTRMARAHISVSFAGLLHSLYTAVGLEMSPWSASASRR